MFQPGLQNNDLFIEYDGNRLFQSNLESLKIGEKVQWNENVEPSIIKITLPTTSLAITPEAKKTLPERLTGYAKWS